MKAEVLFGHSTIQEIPSQEPPTNGNLPSNPGNGDDTGVVADMLSARYGHSMVRLLDGRIMTTGGVNEDSELQRKINFYDPASNQWTEGPEMSIPRGNHASVLLKDGRVLVTGGFGLDEQGEMINPVSEIFDPQTNSVSTAAPLPVAIPFLGMAALKNGKVFVTGGMTVDGDILDSVYMYDPVQDTWTSGVSMAVPRGFASAVTLNDGRVLVAGGYDGSNVLSSVEIFNPDTNSWSFAASMLYGGITSSVLLKDGRVMVFVGEEILGKIQIYDPANNSWTSQDFPESLGAAYAATVELSDGRVIIAGGMNEDGFLSRVATYSPSLDLWRPIVRKMSDPLRIEFASTLLNDGRVFIMGGIKSNDTKLGNPEIYDVVSNTWTPAAPSGTLTIILHSLATLPDGRVLLTGGFDEYNQTRPGNTVEVYDPTANSWSPVAPMNAPRFNHASVTLDDGRVLVIGGTAQPSDTAEAYDPVTNTWSYVAALGIPRPNKYNATKLKDGRVLVLSGSTVLLYDPTEDTWAQKSSMAIAPDRDQAVLSALPDGRAFVTTGIINGGTATTSTSEVYNPMTDTWTAAASLNSPKFPQGKAGASGVTLLDGRVLVLGGVGVTGGNYQFDSDIKIYNPVTDTWE